MAQNLVVLILSTHTIKSKAGGPYCLLTITSQSLRKIHISLYRNFSFGGLSVQE